MIANALRADDDDDLSALPMVRSPSRVPATWAQRCQFDAAFRLFDLFTAFSPVQHRRYPEYTLKINRPDVYVEERADLDARAQRLRDGKYRLVTDVA